MKPSRLARLSAALLCAAALTLGLSALVPGRGLVGPTGVARADGESILSGLYIMRWTATGAVQWNQSATATNGSGDPVQLDGQESHTFSGVAVVQTTWTASTNTVQVINAYTASATGSQYTHAREEVYKPSGGTDCGPIDTSQQYSYSDNNPVERHWLQLGPALQNTSYNGNWYPGWIIAFPFPSIPLGDDLFDTFQVQESDHNAYSLSTGSPCFGQSGSTDASQNYTEYGTSFSAFLRPTLDVYGSLDPAIVGNADGSSFSAHLQVQHSYAPYVFPNYYGNPVPYVVTWDLVATRLPGTAYVDETMALDLANTFLPAVALSDGVTADLGCDQPGGCEFGHKIQSPGQPATSGFQENVLTGNYPTSINVGSLPPGTTFVTSQAEAGGPVSSSTKPVVVCGNLPPWLAGLIISAAPRGTTAYYSTNVKFPDPAWSFSVDPPAWFPFVGGKSIALKNTQGSLKLNLPGEGPGSLAGGWQTGFTVAGQTIQVTVAAQDTIQMDRQNCVRLGLGQFSLQGADVFTTEETIADLFGASFLNYELRGIPFVNNLLNVATVEYELKPNLLLAAVFSGDPNNGNLVIQGGSGTPALEGKVTSGLHVPKGASVKASVAGGGEVSLLTKWPPFSLESVEAKVFVLLQLVLYKFQLTPTVGCTWTSPGNSGGCTTSPGGAGGSSSASSLWTNVDRSYVSKPGYHRWTAPPAGAIRAASASASSNPPDVQLAANVYPQADPSLAIGSGGQRILTWSYDRPDLPPLSSNEIAFSASSGAGQGWSSWSQATTDTQDDYNKSVVFLANGNALAAWERLDTSSPPDFSSNSSGYLSHVQVAAALWNGSIWTAPTQLSISGSLNSRPLLQPTTNGAVAIWTGNPADQIIGTAASPDVVFAAVYSASSGAWSTPTAVITNVVGLMDYSLASTGNTASLVYAVDADGDLSTTTDEALYVTNWDGASWSTPTRLTTQLVSEDSPQLVFTSAGTPQLLWRQSGQLMFLNGTWDVTQAVSLAFPDAAAASSVNLVNASDGTIALTWPQPTAVETRIGYAIFDPVQQKWSDELSLTPPATGSITGTTTAVVALSPVLEPGRLSIAYTMDDIIATVITSTTGITIPNVPQVSDVSLRYAEIPLGRNLSISAADVSVSPLNALPGQPITITAVVHNVGQLAVPAFDVGLVQTNGASTPLVDVTTGALEAGGVVTMTLPFTQPSLATGSYAVVVDPSQLLQETSRADNTASIDAGWTLSPLVTTYLPSGPQIFATAQQSGLVSTEPITLSLRLDNPAGPEVGQVDLSMPTDGSTVITATSVLSPTVVGAGQHLVYWETMSVNPANGPWTTLGTSDASVLPSLTVPDDEVVFGQSAGATAPITLNIWNEGDEASSGGRVAIYDADPTAGAANQLGSFPLPNVLPGDFVPLTGTLQLSGFPAATTGLSVIYIQIDPDNVIQQLTTNNALTEAGAPLGPGLVATSPTVTPTPTVSPTATATPVAFSTVIAGATIVVEIPPPPAGSTPIAQLLISATSATPVITPISVDQLILAFNIDAKDAGGNPIYQLAAPLTITVRFRPDPAQKLNPMLAQIYTSLNGKTEALSTQVTDNGDGTFTARAQTSHLSTFELFAPGQGTPVPILYLPATVSDASLVGW